MKPFIFFLLCLPFAVLSQSVGIGTSSPNAKAALHIQSTNQGVLFPMLTSAQRDAITSPPNGLHIFNKDERCLNYYDSLFQVWNCYCDNDTCKQVTITLTPGCNINFQTQYASKYPGVSKFHLRINAGDTIFGCGTALDFSTVTNQMVVHIINMGVIIGHGGAGGSGATGQAGSCLRIGGNGGPGGNAISTSLAATIQVDNHGSIIAGGGGGGGGGGSAGAYGGGGGAGAGYSIATGGPGGGTTFAGPFGSCGTGTQIAQSGSNGTITGFGTGGNGANGGGKGGDGSGWGLVGKNGTGANAGLGGTAGKAIAGGSGNSIVNHGSAIVVGAIN